MPQGSSSLSTSSVDLVSLFSDDGGKDVWFTLLPYRPLATPPLGRGQRIIFELAPDKTGKPLRAAGLRLLN